MSLSQNVRLLNTRVFALSFYRKAARVLLTMDAQDPRRLFEGKQKCPFNSTQHLKRIERTDTDEAEGVETEICPRFFPRMMLSFFCRY